MNLVKYSTYVPGGMYSSSFYFFINGRKYNSMTAAEKAAVAKYSGEAYARIAGRGWDKNNNEGYEAALKNGNKIVTAPPAVVNAVKKLAVKFRADYAKSVKPLGLDGNAIMNYFFSELRKAQQGN